jgi:hypothetical protein
MPFLENLETSIADDDGMPDNKKVINNGLALKVFEEEVCDHCSCKTTVTNEMIEVQTSFEE